MPSVLRTFYACLALFLSSVTLFLSAWIVVPAPTLALLPLGVATPELSPWLIGFNAIACLLASLGMRRSWLQRLAVLLGLMGLGLSMLPLLQLPLASQRNNDELQVNFGASYEQVSQQLDQQAAQSTKEDLERPRSQPFVLQQVFTGIPASPVRYAPNIPFAKPDGVQLSMDVYRPPQVGRYPALVVIYGGAWRGGSPLANAVFSRYMAARGYTVFAIDYRHAPQHQFPAQLEDVRTALAFVREHATEYEADGDRIALLGRSAGGHLAMLAAYQPDALPIRAVVSYYGPFNLTAGYTDPPEPDPIDVRAVLRAFLGGTPTEKPALYRQASPATYVTRPLPPTLLVHGRRDHLVEVKFAQRMYQRLRSVGSPVALLELPWAEHSFDEVFQGLGSQVTLYYVERFLAWALR
ncbi:alpha/beta hydrolase [Trichocoleus sp. FACHB-262]|uniref:alpha/beta hydrolase n=1 Tax=Trichocoleus sp. FACHB-262 TaxID=2692869 RepID=UPI001689B1AE|nr:alpha/beta hydrolase [Trichocoleus sp. FACHB-262]MBD2120689.1 alpha/beta hydrolase [Trichocoleus sp. FACHB-262]